MAEETQKQLIQDRMHKLEELKQSGINPFPYRYEPTHHSIDIKHKYPHLQPAEHTNDEVCVAGRIMLFRKMGKASFIKLQDQMGAIQIYIAQDILGESQYDVLKKLDLGDIIGVKGTIFATKTGEITVEAKELTLLCKSLTPLPDKYHGIADKELRYRKRYVDLLVNPDIKRVFEKRSLMIKSIREFLDKRGFLEVETPLLQTQYGGASARPFITHINAWDMNMYLSISPELFLKRLVVGGFERVYTICKNFRNEGVDHSHNPEFTMIEIYQAYADYNDMMKLIEDCYEFVCLKVNGTTKVNFKKEDGTVIELDFKAPWKKITLFDAVKEHLNIDVEKMSASDLEQYCIDNRIEIKDMSWGALVQTIFDEKVEDKIIQPTHVYDRLKEATPLCKRSRKDDRLNEQCEPVCMGMELGNMYSELNNPILQEELLQEQVEKGRGGDEEAHPMDEDFIESIKVGLPPTGGIGWGIDRMALVILGQESIRDVIFFPTMRPEQKDEKQVSKEEKVEEKKEEKKEIKKVEITHVEHKTVVSSHHPSNHTISISLEKAHELFDKYVKTDSLRKHSLASAVVLKAMAKHLGKSESEQTTWEIAGLLHDIDFDEIKDDVSKHGVLSAQILRENGVGENIVHAILAHNTPATGVSPETELDFALTSGETVTGLIIATAMIYPDKKIKSVKSSSVQKRIKEKAFARNVNRDLIVLCEKVGISIDAFIDLSLKAMQDIDEKLGL